MRFEKKDLTDEEIVLREIEQRLKRGRTDYGDLDINNDRRNWINEALEEALDLSVYLSIQLIKLRNLS